MTDMEVIALCVAIVAGVAIIARSGDPRIWAVIVIACVVYVLLGTRGIQ
jgi:hypothetical protein